MAKVARIRNKLSPYVYQDVIRAYKTLLREGNKHKLYFFKGIVCCCLNPSTPEGWRKPDEFLSEMCNEYCGGKSTFEHYYDCHRMTNGKMRWFGRDIKECIKEILQ
jgi:hypothetical protein